MPALSVVVATVDRPDALKACLAGIDRLEGAIVEVIVVVGPGGESTIEELEGLPNVATVIANPVRNLSVSRNLGLDEATGEFVGFLDDDAIPTERWLADLLPHFDDPEVAAVGGPVFDYTGHSLQARYSRCTRAGDATVVLTPPIRGLTETPAAGTFDYPIGTNLVVRADAVAAVGGFDEQFDYFHDETDLARRLLNHGWIVRVAQHGAVVHRYLPSSTRGSDRVATDRRSILVNRAYFAARHQLPDEGVAAVRRDFDAFVAHHRSEMEAAGLDDATLARFDEHAKEAHLRLAGWLQAPPVPRRHVPDPTSVVAHQSVTTGAASLRRHIIVVSAIRGGDGDANVARALASDGHTVRLVDFDGGSHHRVDFEGGFWRHRLGDLPLPLPRDLAEVVDPDDRSTWRPLAAALSEVTQIDTELWSPSAIVIEATHPLARCLAQRGYRVVDPDALGQAGSIDERTAILDEA